MGATECGQHMSSKVWGYVEDMLTIDAVRTHEVSSQLNKISEYNLSIY